MRQLLSLLGLVTGVLFVASCSSETGTTSGGTADEAKFKRDVMPIVRESCALTACHSSESKNLGIFLSNDAAQVYTELQKTSGQSGQKFVVAGDVAKSYLVTKMEGKQKKPEQGEQMPPDGLVPSDQRETIKSWIAAGAKDN